MGRLAPGDPTATTDANGNYTFTGLLPGSYTVGEVRQPGYIGNLSDFRFVHERHPGYRCSGCADRARQHPGSQPALGEESLADANALTNLTTALSNPLFFGLNGSGGDHGRYRYRHQRRPDLFCARPDRLRIRFRRQHEFGRHRHQLAMAATSPASSGRTTRRIRAWHPMRKTDHPESLQQCRSGLLQLRCRCIAVGREQR